MDIKSKNIRYSIFSKAIAVFLLWASLAGLCASAVYLAQNYNYYNSKDFHTTSNFLNEFHNYTNSAVTYAISDMKKEYVNGELQFYRDLGKQLSAVTNFAYIVVDRVTGTFVSNMKIESYGDLQKNVDKLKKQPFNLSISKEDRSVTYQAYAYWFDDLKESFKDTSFEMYAAAMEPFKKDDAFYEQWNRYNNAKELTPIFIGVLVLSLLLGISSFVYLVIFSGRKEKNGQIRLCFADRIYTDIHTAFVILAAALSVSIVQGMGNPGNFSITALLYFILLSIDMFIGLSYTLSLVRHFKNHSLLKHTLLYTLGRALMSFVRRCMIAKTFRLSVIILLLAYGLLNSFLFAILTNHGSPIFFLLWLVLNIAAVYQVSKSLVSLSDIMKWVKGISTGNLVDSPDIKNLSPAFSSFAGDVLNLQSGLRNAVTEAVKGERLKTELITNVSHDLKTPLTSIINYVDLLKKEETESENIRQYTAILEEKSSRLKQLIDDLIEASKASSGNLAVNFESIDLYSLTLQASAEFGEKAAAAGLDFRIKPVETAPLIHADGKLMWRIMENLLSNVLKYSQKDSRVYLEVETSGLYGMITIKNISSLPLDIPADQLMERFVRGDRSRSEEGSGLGLAIAKSLAEVQGGRLEIVIDGDLFKVSVSIPLLMSRG